MLYSDNIKKVENNRDEYLFLGEVYAHFKLHDLLHYDLLATDDKLLYNNINYYQGHEKFIESHEVEDLEGNYHKVTMYLWLNKPTKKYMGLVCLKDDIEGNRDAENKLNNMTQRL
jgi:hypothetical protein